jgi:hypothetical protein
MDFTNMGCGMDSIGSSLGPVARNIVMHLLGPLNIGNLID